MGGKRAGDVRGIEPWIGERATLTNEPCGRAERKRLAAVDPAAAAAEVIAKQKRKREAKKRKLDKANPHRVKRRAREARGEEEED